MANIRYVSNNGVWHPGEVVGFQFYTDYTNNWPELWLGGICAIGNQFYFDPALEGDFSLRLYASPDHEITGGISLTLTDWRDTESSNWVYMELVVPDVAPGQYYLKWARQNVEETFEGEFISLSYSHWESYEITIPFSVDIFIPDPIVAPRPIDYDPDLGWDEENSIWTPTIRGGGRYRQQLIAVGKDGEIYYGDA